MQTEFLFGSYVNNVKNKITPYTFLKLNLS